MLLEADVEVVSRFLETETSLVTLVFVVVAKRRRYLPDVRG